MWDAQSRHIICWLSGGKSQDAVHYPLFKVPPSALGLQSSFRACKLSLFILAKETIFSNNLRNWTSHSFSCHNLMNQIAKTFFFYYALYSFANQLIKIPGPWLLGWVVLGFGFLNYFILLCLFLFCFATTCLITYQAALKKHSAFFSHLEPWLFTWSCACLSSYM